MYVCIYIHIYIYIHAHTHAYSYIYDNHVGWSTFWTFTKVTKREPDHYHPILASFLPNEFTLAVICWQASRRSRSLWPWCQSPFAAPCRGTMAPWDFHGDCGKKVVGIAMFSLEMVMIWFIFHSYVMSCVFFYTTDRVKTKLWWTICM